jgi:hypothetical protein
VETVLQGRGESGGIEVAIGDDVDVDALLGLADLILADGGRFDHDGADRVRVDLDVAVAERRVGLPVNGGA